MSPGVPLHSVALKVQRQKMPEWCWAALAVSVNLFFRPDSQQSQCTLAGSILDRDCCSESGPCNLPHELHTVLGTLHLRRGNPVIRPDAPIPFNAVRREIDAGRPVCLLIKWLDKRGQLTNLGHFIAIRGYRVTPGGKQFVSIGDSLYGSSEIDFKRLSDPAGGYHDGKGLWFAAFHVNNPAAAS